MASTAACRPATTRRGELRLEDSGGDPGRSSVAGTESSGVDQSSKRPESDRSHRRGRRRPDLQPPLTRRDLTGPPGAPVLWVRVARGRIVPPTPGDSDLIASGVTQRASRRPRSAAPHRACRLSRLCVLPRQQLVKLRLIPGPSIRGVAPCPLADLVSVDLQSGRTLRPPDELPLVPPRVVGQYWTSPPMAGAQERA